MICRPSGVHATVKGRAWPLGSSVPTRTRAASAPGAPVRARSTSMMEIVFPSKSACPLSRAVTAMNLPFGLALMPKGPVCTGNARRDFDDRHARERLVEIHHGHIVRARVTREKISLSVASAAQGEKFRIRPAAELQVGSFERNDRRRSRGNEGNGEARAGVCRMSERHLDLPPTASGVSIDEADAIRAVLGQPVFRVAHEEQLGKDHETDRPEITAV